MGARIRCAVVQQRRRRRQAGGQASLSRPPAPPAAAALCGYHCWRQQQHSPGEGDVAGPAHSQCVVAVVGLCLFCVAIFVDPDVHKIDLDKVRLRHCDAQVSVDNLNLQYKCSTSAGQGVNVSGQVVAALRWGGRVVAGQAWATTV